MYLIYPSIYLIYQSYLSMLSIHLSISYVSIYLSIYVFLCFSVCLIYYIYNYVFIDFRMFNTYSHHFYCDNHDGDYYYDDDDYDDDIDNDHDDDVNISIIFLRRRVSLKRTSLATIWFLKMIVSLWSPTPLFLEMCSDHLCPLLMIIYVLCL